MYKVGIIEESLSNPSVLDILKPYQFTSRTEQVPEDESPVWHINEYHINDPEIISSLLNQLAASIKKTWYIHLFSETTLYVILYQKWFALSPVKDDSWNEMLDYGRKIAKVEPSYLENIPLTI